MAKPRADEALILSGIRRAEAGTTIAKQLRTQGFVPGVVYGKKTEAMAVAINQRELAKVLRTEAGEHALLTLRITDGAPAGAAAGKAAGHPWEKPVLVKAVQHDPVDGRVIHVDFHAIVLTERIRVKIPVQLVGDPAGVKEQGGVLEHFLREIEVECLPTHFPKHLDFNVSALAIGDAVHVRDLTPPAEARVTSDPAGVVASVLAPKEEKPEEEAAVTEPEVLSEKKKEPEAGEAGKAEPAAEAKAEGKKRDEKKD